LPVLLRDAQVLPIWEGTTNVLSLDTLRAMSRDPSVLAALRDEISAIVGETEDQMLAEIGRSAGEAVGHATEWVSEAVRLNPSDVEAGARRFALTLGRATELALLVRQGQRSLAAGDPRPSAAARRFALTPIDLLRQTDRDDSKLLALG
jgi:hypothetical protein